MLILIDLPRPSHYAAEGYRVLWTLGGAGLGLIVMLLAGLYAKQTAKTSPKRAREQALPLPNHSFWRRTALPVTGGRTRRAM
ncbi:hypothetical protein OV450_6420 [Actinobacteria bacterium OV450]|nr:hypothetical protein OV450_6420 [Actinobacteria bacterium OV450]